MSFWSSLVLARAAPPPVVTVAALGSFVRNLAATGALVGGEDTSCQIKYGTRVDADERTVNVIEYGDVPGIITYGEYPWDRSDTFPSLDASADALATDGGTVYRAHLGLGSLHPKIVAALTRDPCAENENGLCLWDLTFSVGPVLVEGLGSDASGFAGWMELVLSGQGYFYPWTYRQARERAEAVELVRRLVEVCRATWPVPPTAASAEAIAGRRQLAEMWLYDDFAAPPDWLWFVSESG